MQTDIERPAITYLPYRGLWEATKENERNIFFSQIEAEKFAGVEYDSDKDSKYWQQRFPQHFN